MLLTLMISFFYFHSMTTVWLLVSCDGNFVYFFIFYRHNIKLQMDLCMYYHSWEGFKYLITSLECTKISVNLLNLSTRWHD